MAIVVSWLAVALPAPAQLSLPVADNPILPRTIATEPPRSGFVPPGTAVSGTVVDPPVPVVSVRVRVPATATPGKELEYRIVVENTSRATAHHVVVRCASPSHSKYMRAEPKPDEEQPELRWKLGSLPGLARREITLVVEPTGEGEIETVARVMFEHGQRVKTRIGKSSLQLRFSNPAQASLNDIVTFSLDVTNNGEVPVEDVVVTNPLPPELDFSNSAPAPASDQPLTWRLDTLAPGQTRRIETQVIAKKTGTFVNSAEVQGKGARSQAQGTIVIGAADLSITMTGPSRRLLKSAATYRILVHNKGTLPATNVQVVNVVPSQIRFLRASEGGRLIRNEVLWNLGTLVPGARKSFEVVLQSQEAGELINRATVRAGRGLISTAEARTAFEEASGLAVEIEKSVDPVEVNGQVVYTVRILNEGTGPARDIRLAVTAPAEMKVLDSQGQTPGTVQGQQVAFEPIAMLPSRGEARYNVRVQAVQAGAVRLRVEVNADQLTAPIVSEETTTIYSDR
jgi:uncharacterized repeat protein (TIGR01451 family)